LVSLLTFSFVLFQHVCVSVSMWACHMHILSWDHMTCHSSETCCFVFSVPTWPHHPCCVPWPHPPWCAMWPHLLGAPRDPTSSVCPVNPSPHSLMLVHGSVYKGEPLAVSNVECLNFFFLL
jgi:hypothetical protein